MIFSHSLVCRVCVYVCVWQGAARNILLRCKTSVACKIVMQLPIVCKLNVLLLCHTHTHNLLLPLPAMKLCRLCELI